MRTTNRLHTLGLLLALAVALTALPALAQPTPPHGPLHPKSTAGLMPPAYLLDPDAPALPRIAAGAPALFAAPISTFAGGWAQVLGAASFNADRRAEAAVGAGYYFDPANDRQVHLFAQAGAGFTRIQKRPIGADPAAALVADVNLDGRDDLALAVPDSNQLAIYTQTTSATAPLSSPLFLPQAGAPDALAALDITGDLRPDLAVVAPGASAIRFWHSTPTGLKASNLALKYSTGAYNALATGDLNNDGEDDLIALHGSGIAYQGHEASILLQQHGAFPASATRSVTSGIYLAQSTAVGDINGDGLDDLVVSAGGNAPDAYLNVWLQSASGLATTATTYPAYHIPSAIAIGDVNHDGLNDVIIAHDGWSTVSIYLQNSSHTLESYIAIDIPYSSYYRPSALALADFDGNGGLDIGLVGQEAGLTVLPNRLALPSAAIVTPARYTSVPAAGTLLVTGTAELSATQVQVRLKGGPAGWQSVTPSNGVWQAELSLPTTQRSWWVEARAIDASHHVQSPPARQRILAESVAYAVADNSGVPGSPDRLMRINLRSAEATLVGNTGTDSIHALAVKPGSTQLYSADDQKLGRLDLATGRFTAVGSRLGKGNGAKGKITFSNLIGLAFHPVSGELFAVHRRSSSNSQDLLLKINAATGAFIPNAFGAGVDYAVISGTGALNDIDDIAFDPQTHNLYGVANQDGRNDALVIIDPQTGAATVVGALHADNMEGLTFAGNQLIGTTGRKSAPTANRLWAIDKAHGAATLINPISAQRDYEGIACLPAGVALPPTTAATARVRSISIQDQTLETGAPSVMLSADTVGDADRHVFFVEYSYQPQTQRWVRAEPASIAAQWFDASAAAAGIHWQLAPNAGVKYLQAWVADGNRHIQPLAEQTYINYLPPTSTVAQGAGQIYRYTLSAGEQLTAHLESIAGDADLYIWSVDPDAPPSLSNRIGLPDDVVLTAAADGLYQIEVRGSSAATYRLTVAITAGPGALLAALPQIAAPVVSSKPVVSVPLIPLDSEPLSTPPGDARAGVYLPLMYR